MTDSLKQQLKDNIKQAMRDKNKPRLGALRLASAEIKRIEVDERVELDDERTLTVLVKMIKQRRDSITQYTDAGRVDLADVEAAEISVLQEFMPAALSADEIIKLIDDAIAATGATSVKDMGKVMGLIKPTAQGRADMGEVGKLIKARLN
jgi:uncharacterized protein YqeY